MPRYEVKLDAAHRTALFKKQSLPSQSPARTLETTNVIGIPVFDRVVDTWLCTVTSHAGESDVVSALWT